MGSMWRQGDVLVQKIERLPDGLTPEEPDGRGRIVLAEGEATGHAHAIAASRLSRAGRDAAGVLYFRVGRGATAILEHEEHTAHEFGAGSYRVVRQREYHPEAIKNVAD